MKSVIINPFEEAKIHPLVDPLARNDELLGGVIATGSISSSSMDLTSTSSSSMNHSIIRDNSSIDPSPESLQDQLRFFAFETYKDLEYYLHGKYGLTDNDISENAIHMNTDYDCAAIQNFIDASSSFEEKYLCSLWIRKLVNNCKQPR